MPNAEARAGADRDDILEQALWAYGWAEEIGPAGTLVERELRELDPTACDPLRLLYLRLNQMNFPVDFPANPVSDADARVHLLRDGDAAGLTVQPDVRPNSERIHAAVRPDRGPGPDRRADGPRGRHLGGCRDPMGPGDDNAISTPTLLSARGDFEAAEKLLTEALALARAECSAAEVIAVESGMVGSLCRQGRYVEAAELGRGILRRVAAPDQARWMWRHAHEELIPVLLEVGRWGEIDALLQTGPTVDTFGMTGVALDILQGLLDCYRGDLDGASAREASARAKSSGVTSFAVKVQIELELEIATLAAHIAAARGDLTSARRHLEPLWQLTEQQRRTMPMLWRPMLLAARLEADDAAQAPRRRRRDDAIPGRRRRRGLIEELRRTIPALGPVEAWNAQLDAELSRIDGNADSAYWQRAVDAWAATGQSHDQAWALVRYAECQITADQRPTAISSLTTARAIGTELRAEPLVRAVDDLARKSRLTVAADARDDRRPPVRHGLTARELDVLGLIAQGRSNDQIAKELYISPKTVSVHVSHVLAKLDVASRAQATTVAHQLGLLGGDPTGHAHGSDSDHLPSSRGL